MKPVQRVRMPKALQKLCPCQKCEERFPACHGKCEKYLTWRAQVDEEKGRQIEEVKKDSIQMSFLMDSRERTMKKVNAKKAKRTTL